MQRIISFWENTWKENGIFGVNITESNLDGTNYVRSVKGMQLGKPLRQLQRGEIFQQHNKKSYHGLVEDLSQIREDV